MAKKAKLYTPNFKFKVVVESLLKGNVAEVARQYGINPNQLSSWRSQFNSNGHLIFDKNNSDIEHKFKKSIAKLVYLIGKKEVELNLLKSYLDFYFPPDIKYRNTQGRWWKKAQAPSIFLTLTNLFSCIFGFLCT